MNRSRIRTGGVIEHLFTSPHVLRMLIDHLADAQTCLVEDAKQDADPSSI